MNTITKMTLISVAALSMAACGATTGGVAGSGAVKAQAMMAEAPAPAPASESRTYTAQPAEVPITASDMSAAVTAPMPEARSKACTKLYAQIAEQDVIIADANNVLNGGTAGDTAAKLGTSIATQAALHNGAAQVMGKVPFGGLFAKAGMDYAASSGERKAKAARDNLNNATLKRAKLAGKYEGKGCV